MRERLRWKEMGWSMWGALTQGSRRPLAVIGALTALVPLVLWFFGRSWTPWWLVAALLFLLLFVGSAFHDLRVKYNELARDPYELLTAQMRKIDGVRLWLNLLDGTEAAVPLEEDRVFLWAKETYKLLLDKFPAEADGFLAEENAALGSAYFATTYAFERRKLGRQEYLETRVEIIRSILLSKH